MLAASLAACGGPGPAATDLDPVVGGALQNLTNPEIGRFITPFSGSCTATLIAPDVAITAAHCVRYESSGSGGGQLRIRSRQGNVDARVRAFRSFSTRPGRGDVALLKLDRAVPSRVATPRPLAARAPRRGEAVELWGYGCTIRGTRNSQGKTTIAARYGSSQNLCKGDSGGPLLNAEGQILAVNSAYDTISGADIFALPSSLRAGIEAQVTAFGHTGGVFGTRAGNTQGGEAGALSASARVWRQTAGLRACGDWTKDENFSSGRYNAHRYRLSLSPGGEVDVSLGRLGGRWAPAIVVAAAGGAPLSTGRDRATGVTVRVGHDGRDGNPARVTLSAERAVALDVYVSGWRAVQSSFRDSLTRSARYRLSMQQACGARPEPPPQTGVARLPFRTRGDTRQGENVISYYGCAPNTDERGPEVVYTIDAPVGGVITAQLSDLAGGVDVDVHILVGDTCVARGHWTASARVPPGRHRVIVDTWVDASNRTRPGPFTLEVGYVCTTDLVAAGLTAVAADRALTGYAQAFAAGATDQAVLTVVDLDAPSDAARLLAYDMARQRVVARGRVGHGAGSTLPLDPRRVVSAGEDLGRSPVGLLLTAEADATRLRLDGLEPGFNATTRDRGLAFVADPALKDAAPTLTDGSFSVAPETLAALVGAAREGGLVVVHLSDPTWVEHSAYLEE